MHIKMHLFWVPPSASVFEVIERCWKCGRVTEFKLSRLCQRLSREVLCYLCVAGWFGQLESLAAEEQS